MKLLKVLLMLQGLLLAVSVYSQQRIVMEYDNAGNRIHRKVITLPKQTRSLPVDADLDSTKEYQSDMFGEREIRIYPNPTKGALLIKVIGAAFDAPVPVRVFGESGALLIQKSFSGAEMSLDLSEYPAGIYILSILMGGTNKEFKVIKE